MTCNEPVTTTASNASSDAIEAAAFRSLIAHLRQRSDVQNIDLMILAGFCRNCLADWYQQAAAGVGTTLSREQAREYVYGMPFPEWKALHQAQASAEQMARYDAAMLAHPKASS